MAAWEEEQGRLLRENLNLVKSSPPPSLVDLGGYNLDLDYYLEHREEFYQLPAEVVQGMILKCERLLDPKYFPLLLKPGCSSVLIPCFRHRHNDTPIIWRDVDINSAMTYVKEHCAPGSLEVFGLCKGESIEYEECQCQSKSLAEIQDDERLTCRNPDLEILHDILRAQPNLKELHLHCDITRETLGIIADNCHQLRSLTFVKCHVLSLHSIDLATMRQLVDGCPLLRKLYCLYTDNAANNYAVQNLMHLVLFSPYFSLTNPPTFLRTGQPLPHFRPNVLHIESSSPFPDLPLINSHFPNIHNLFTTGENLDKFQCRSVKSLKVQGIGSSEHMSIVESFLARCGTHIKELHLLGVLKRPDNPSLDLSTIFHHCPNLLHLIIGCLNFTSTCKHPITPERVGNLRCLSVISYSVATPPDSALHPVVCNGVLEHLRLPILSSGLVARLTTEMRGAVEESKPSPVLPKLTHLWVDWGMNPNSQWMTLVQGISVVTLAPKLRKYQFRKIQPAVRDLLEGFLERYRNFTS